MKKLTIEIDKCKDCAYAYLRYDNPMMNYRNDCEHPKGKRLPIYSGDTIPDNCPLPEVIEISDLHTILKSIQEKDYIAAEELLSEFMGE